MKRVDLVKHLKSQDNAQYDNKLISWIEEEADRQNEDSTNKASSDDDDPKWDDAISIGQTHGVISASFLQRHLKIGYNRAATLIEKMQDEGVLSAPNTSGKREIIDE